MEITFGVVESATVKATGSTETIKINGTINLDSNKKVISCNGTFETILDKKQVGTFSMYNSNQYNYNINDNELSCDCVNALKLFISSAETAAMSKQMSV